MRLAHGTQLAPLLRNGRLLLVRHFKMDDAESNSQRTKVIVVERYPLARTVLADLLVGDGYRVFQSDSAESAITCIDQNKDVAAVLADLEMPGWKSLVRYTLATASNTSVIAMLAGHSIVDPEELRRRGIKCWIVKPVVYDDIQRLLRSGEKQKFKS
jgi:CheY-like chemotaxis protein